MPRNQGSEGEKCMVFSKWVSPVSIFYRFLGMFSNSHSHFILLNGSNLWHNGWSYIHLLFVIMMKRTHLLCGQDQRYWQDTDKHWLTLLDQTLTRKQKKNRYLVKVIKISVHMRKAYIFGKNVVVDFQWEGNRRTKRCSQTTLLLLGCFYKEDRIVLSKFLFHCAYRF